MEYLLSQEDLNGDPEYIVMVTEVAAPSDFYPESDCVYIPERIIWRIIGIGKAYNLQFVKHVSPNMFDRWVYRGETLSWVNDELLFIIKLINDPVLVKCVENIMALFSKAILQPNKFQVAIEGP